MVCGTLLCSLVPESFPRGLLCRPAHASSVFVLNVAERRGSPSGGGGWGSEEATFSDPFSKGGIHLLNSPRKLSRLLWVNLLIHLDTFS